MLWLFVPTRVDVHKGLTSVPTPPYLGIFS